MSISDIFFYIYIYLNPTCTLNWSYKPCLTVCPLNKRFEIASKMYIYVPSFVIFVFREHGAVRLIHSHLHTNPIRYFGDWVLWSMSCIWNGLHSYTGLMGTGRQIDVIKIAIKAIGIFINMKWGIEVYWCVCSWLMLCYFCVFYKRIHWLAVTQ